jgi:hypothetical protein
LPKIKSYINKIKDDVESQAGISKLRLIRELKALALTNMDDLSDDWLSLADYKSIPRKYKKAIREVTREDFYDKEGQRTTKFKIKLYNKRAAIETIFRAMGYNKERGDIDIGDKNIVVNFGKE